MSILFRCPCGRSMVVESDKAGAIVMCPNCRRRLRVPSGKGRGVEIPAAPAASRTSRRCPRCGKDVPVDSQMCPHCNTILIEASAPQAATSGGTAAPPARRSVAPARRTRSPIAQPAGGIVYGGARGSWFTRLTSRGKAGVLIGAGAFLMLLAILALAVGLSHSESELRNARETGHTNLDEGRQLETEGKFQEAYDLYYVPKSMLEALKNSDHPGDPDLAEQLQRRATALQYLVHTPKVRGSVYWRPQSRQELNEAMAHLRATYPAYRQLCLSVADAGLAAVKTGKEGAGRAAFQQKVASTMEAYMRLVDQTTKQQRSQITFAYQLSRGVAELGEANEHYDTSQRQTHLKSAEAYFAALKERVSKEGYPDAILTP